MEQELINFGESRTVLSKDSSDFQLRAYFEAVRKLYNCGDAYPVDLDEVWMLVYSERGKAVRALKESFIENEDYTSFAQNGKTATGGYKKTVYKLSLSCMEYLIAKKVREVFNVYRDVFKKIVTGEVQVQMKPKSANEMFLMQAQINLEQEKRINVIEQRLDKMEEERKENGRLLLETKVSANAVPAMTLRKSIIALVNEYSAATNTKQQDVWHSVYKDLYYKYNKSINSYKRLFSRESKLDIAEREGFLQPIFDIISDMIVRWREEKK